MGMFYVFYLASNDKSNFDQVKQSVIEITPKVSADMSRGRTQISENIDDLLSVWCEYYSLRVKNGGQHTEFRSEDYGIKFQYQFWFDIYTVTPNWMEKMLSFVGQIMKMFDSDCVLESNGDTPIVERKDGIIIVDDKNLNGTQSFPFDVLGIEYREGDLKQV